MAVNNETGFSSPLKVGQLAKERAFWLPLISLRIDEIMGTYRRYAFRCNSISGHKICGRKLVGALVFNSPQT